MPAVTGLRETRDGLVAVEIEGVPWRLLPVDVVVRAGLAAGEQLDRARLRELAQELRRARARRTALRAVAQRDLSAQRLRERLKGQRIRGDAREHAVETLQRAGLVDDARYAARRATSLADRGHGDAAIRWRLESEGVPAVVADEALAELEPEVVRASRIVAAKGPGVRAARELARRGFGEDAIEQALGGVAEDARAALDS